MRTDDIAGWLLIAGLTLIAIACGLYSVSLMLAWVGLWCCIFGYVGFEIHMEEEQKRQAEKEEAQAKQ